MMTHSELISLATEAGARLNSRGQGTCPFHDDESPSFSVYELGGKARWKCHGACGDGGDAADFLVKAKGLTLKEAMERAGLSNNGKQKRREWVPQKVPGKPAKPKSAPVGMVEARGEPDQTWEWRGPDGYRATQWRWNGTGQQVKEMRWQKGTKQKWLVYPAKPESDTAPDTLVFCEGAKAAEALAGAGLFGVGLPSASASLTVETLNWVHELTPRKKWVLWPDNDAPGEKAMQHIGKLALGYKDIEIRWIDPEGVDGCDAADYPAEARQAKVAGAGEWQPPSQSTQSPTTTERKEPKTEVAVPETAATLTIIPHEEWETDGKGVEKVKNSYRNTRLIVESVGAFMEWDDFSHRPTYTLGEERREYLKDEHWEDWMSLAQQVYSWTPPKDPFLRHLMRLARESRYHPIKDYLEGCPKPTGEAEAMRVIMDITYRGFNVDDSDEVGAMYAMCIRKFACAAVRRIYKPFSKWKYMPVLVSNQEARKSDAVAALCPNLRWFLDRFDFDASTKDQADTLQGKWIVECAELENMGRAGVDKVKAFLSSLFDTYRPSYGRLSLDHERTFVFIATVNEPQFLRDQTGNARFWPVHLRPGLCDVDFIVENRDRFWGAAMHLEPNENLWPDHESMRGALAKGQDDALWEDPWEERIREHGFDGQTATSMLKALYEPTSRGNQMRLAKVLRKMGYKRYDDNYHDDAGKSRFRRIWRVAADAGAEPPI